MDMNKFLNWLNQQLDKRGWSRAELARRAKISEANLSVLYKNDTSPGIYTAEKIAQALDVPAEYVYRLAGILTDPTDIPPDITLVVDILKELPPEFTELALNNARALRDLHEAQQRTKKTGPLATQ